MLTEATYLDGRKCEDPPLARNSTPTAVVAGTASGGEHGGLFNCSTISAPESSTVPSAEFNSASQTPSKVATPSLSDVPSEAQTHQAAKEREKQEDPVPLYVRRKKSGRENSTPRPIPQHDDQSPFVDGGSAARMPPNITTSPSDRAPVPTSSNAGSSVSSIDEAELQRRPVGPVSDISDTTLPNAELPLGSTLEREFERIGDMADVARASKSSTLHRVGRGGRGRGQGLPHLQRLGLAQSTPDDEGEETDALMAMRSRNKFLSPNHPQNEIEAVQQRLAHAQRQMATLRGSLNREKVARMRAEGKVIPDNARFDDQGNLLDDDADNQDEDDEDTAPPKKKSSKDTTPHHVGRGGGRGRGRGRGGLSLVQRLGLAQSTPDDEGEEKDVPVVLSRRQSEDSEEDEESRFFGSSTSASIHASNRERETSGLESPRNSEAINIETSKRTSVEGMDPLFANVLKRVPSTSHYSNGSPLRHSLLRGRRAPSRGVKRVPLPE